MNSAYRDLILSRAAAAVGAARAVKGISHRGLKGAIREILIRDLLRPLMPTDIGVGTGEIISATGKTSSQTDIVIFDRRILPPILFEQAVGIFPIESVLLTMEVKSILKKEDLKSADEAARKLMGFDYAEGWFDETGRVAQAGRSGLPLESTLLALDTEIDSTVSIAASYDELRPPAAGAPAIAAICVVGRGLWLWGGRGWKNPPIRSEHDEIVNLIALVTNSYGRISASRGLPRLGRYIFQEGDFPERDESTGKGSS